MPSPVNPANTSRNPSAIRTTQNAAFMRRAWPAALATSRAGEPVVALIFPVSAGVNIRYRELHDMLGIFKSQLGGDAQPHWRAERRGERLPEELQRQNRLRVQGGGHVDGGI